MKKLITFAIVAIMLAGAFVLPVSAISDDANIEGTVDDFVAQFIDSKTAGAAIAVIRNGEVILDKAYGWANIETQRAANSDDVWEWGSVTKLLIWVSVMQLHEQGKLDLDSDIRAYLPEGFLKELRFDDKITMYHLMNHNAGWAERVYEIFYANPDDIPSLEQSLLNYEPPQIHRPGTNVAYSNFGTGLAGFIVERISGMLFYEYVNANIFEPLGMKDTTIHPTQADNPSIAERRDLVAGHSPVIGLLGIDETKPPVVMKDSDARIYLGLYPAGSAIGTASDAAKFIAALMPPEGSGGILFEARETLDEMLSVSHDYGLDGRAPGIAHGFWERFGAVRHVGHGGNTAGFSANMFFAPCSDFGVVILTNQMGETAITYGLLTELFGEYNAPAHSDGLENMPDARTFGSGMFLMTRTPHRGLPQTINILNILPFSAVDENTIDIAGVRFVQVSPYVFQNTFNENLLDPFAFISFEVDENGNAVRVSTFSTDMIPFMQLPGIIPATIGLAVIGICGSYVFYALIFTIIGAILNKKRGVEFSRVKKLNLALWLLMAAVFANLVVYTVRLTSYVTVAALAPHYFVNIVYMVFALFGVGLMVVMLVKRAESSRASVVFNIFTCVNSVALVATMFMLELWR